MEEITIELREDIKEIKSDVKLMALSLEARLRPLESHVYATGLAFKVFGLVMAGFTVQLLVRAFLH